MTRNTTHVLLTDSEYAAVRAACPEGLRLSAWFRRLALQAAGWGDDDVEAAEQRRVESRRRAAEVARSHRVIGDTDRNVIVNS